MTNKPTLFITLSIVAIVVLAFLASSLKGGDGEVAAAIRSRVPESSLNQSQAPWNYDEKNLASRLEIMKLPALKEEGAFLHTHEHLDVIINGQKINIPKDIGVNHIENFIAPIHTHDETGIIHVESPTIEDYSLGQFFDIWGVRLNEKCLGGYCEGAENNLDVYVNGEKITGNPADILLKERQEIAIIFGNASNTPSSIPKDYLFPTGL